jgi:hypothetical protein
MPRGASGLLVFDALRFATRNLPFGSTFEVHAEEVRDLCKLCPHDLVERGFEETVAERVSAALINCDLKPLSKSIGIILVVSHEANRLVPE